MRSRPSRVSSHGSRQLRPALSEPHPVPGTATFAVGAHGMELRSVCFSTCAGPGRGGVGHFDSKEEAVREVAIPARFSHVALPTHLDEL